MQQTCPNYFMQTLCELRYWYYLNIRWEEEGEEGEEDTVGCWQRCFPGPSLMVRDDFSRIDAIAKASTYYGALAVCRPVALRFTGVCLRECNWHGKSEPTSFEIRVRLTSTVTLQYNKSVTNAKKKRQA
ncbi:hypothetical protein RRG08_040612 [Elysia crispata]|uniref:Uncharacterized protein n=1 Tax=Elysia crispata TaxID=231223 RepID=A0AAE1E9T8_9GAST|nr:hypothetical protein RRG08_040612 [Elysia crispata]